MLTVKTYLAPSKIHGIGLFAAEEIQARSIVWKFNSFIDNVYSHERFLEILNSSDLFTLHHLLNSTYKRSGSYYYITDNARFINHSSKGSNIAFADDHTEIASRLIRRGEELLEDYHLAYDGDDFFFQELVNPSPAAYLQTIAQRRVANV